MQKIIFECETITPMFCYGADGKTPELRPPSIKGALRFWWRAMNGHLPIDKLRERETYIFGGSGNNEGRSKVLIRIKIQEYRINKFSEMKLKYISVKYGSKKVNVDLSKYLGLGMFGMGKEPDHNYIPPNSNFEIIIACPDKLKEEVINSFIAMHYFGNIGAKARNGFGGFRIKNLSEIKDISMIDFVRNITKPQKKIPDFFAFSNKIRIFKADKQNSWYDALSLMGEAYLKSRINIEAHHNYNKRKYVSFPVNARGETINHIIKNSDRHAKPYFFKVIRENEKFIPYIYYFPAEYVKGINYHKNYQNINEQEETKHFLEIMGKFNSLIISNGFSEVKI